MNTNKRQQRCRRITGGLAQAGATVHRANEIENKYKPSDKDINRRK